MKLQLRHIPVLFVLTPFVLFIGVNPVTIILSVIGFVFGLLYGAVCFKKYWDSTKEPIEKIKNIYNNTDASKFSDTEDQNKNKEDINWFIELVKEHGKEQKEYNKVLELLLNYNWMINNPEDFLFPAIKAWSQEKKSFLAKDRNDQKKTYHFYKKGRRANRGMMFGCVNNTIVLNLLISLDKNNIDPPAYASIDKNFLNQCLERFKAILADKLAKYKHVSIEPNLIKKFVKKAQLVYPDVIHYDMIFEESLSALSSKTGSNYEHIYNP